MFAQLRAGYDGAELDVQLTRDKELAVFHDFRLKPRLAGGCRISRPLCDLDYSELLAVKLGNERIPLLRDVIESVQSVRKDFRLFIEIKTSFADPRLSAAPEAVAEAVVGELRGLDFFENTVLVGFDWAALIHAKKIAPGASMLVHARRGPGIAMGAFGPLRRRFAREIRRLFPKQSSAPAATAGFVRVRAPPRKPFKRRGNAA